MHSSSLFLARSDVFSSLQEKCSSIAVAVLVYYLAQSRIIINDLALKLDCSTIMKQRPTDNLRDQVCSLQSSPAKNIRQVNTQQFVSS